MTTPYPRLNVSIQKPNSLCHRSKKFADAVDVVTSFTKVVMERHNSLYLFTVAGAEEETNPTYHESQHKETQTLI
jgi:hypothetical protein